MKGLLEKAEMALRNQKGAMQHQVDERASELVLENRQESREERTEIPELDMESVNAAVDKLPRRNGQSAISLETGRVIPENSASSVNTVVERVSSGIAGLDEQINGGFVKGSVNLVTGSPGSGKTLFASQFIASGIEQDESGLYISLEEKKEQFYKRMLQLGFDFEKHEKEGKFTFLRYSPEQVHALLSDDTLRKGAKRVSIDSLSAFTLLFKDNLSAREGLSELFALTSSLGATAVLTAERETKDTAQNSTEFNVNSIISLSNFRRKNIRQRAAEILKMDNTQFSQKVFPIKIGEDGLTFLG